MTWHSLTQRNASMIHDGLHSVTNDDGDTATFHADQPAVEPSTGADIFGGIVTYIIWPLALVVGFIAIGGVAILDSLLLALFPPRESGR